mgnify:CR=1 FL=1
MYDSFLMYLLILYHCLYVLIDVLRNLIVMFVEIIEDLFADDLLDSEKYVLVFVCDGVVF